MEFFLESYTKLLKHLKASLLITKQDLTIIWTNDFLLSQYSDYFAEGENLISLFPEQDTKLKDIVNNADSDKSCPKNITIGITPFIWDLSVQKIGEDYYLWTVDRSVVQIDIPIPDINEDAESIFESSRIYREGIFFVFNILSMIRTEENAKQIDLAALQCYKMHQTTINRELNALGNSNRSEYDFELVSLAGYFEDLIDKIKRFSKYPEDKIRINIESKDIFAKIDYQKFSVAFYNILSNAYLASVPEGEITISLSVSQKDCIISVSDFGVGIEKKHIGRIFYPYFSVDADGNKNYNKLGLGLSVAKIIVENHGGSIIVSGEPNHGTTVVIRIPLAEAASDDLLLQSPKIKLVSNLSDFYVFLADSCGFDLFADRLS